MRVLIQRVREARVEVDSQSTGAIGTGLLLFLGITTDDEASDIDWLVRKIVQLRIFPDEQGVMNRSALEAGGRFLVISQFTLHASTKKGNRPSYIRAAPPEQAIPLYEQFVQALEEASGTAVETGIFGADMQVHLLNDGPVTIWIDSKNRE
jgi:D-tyrosyl-tRNA(Tyr) deacylase